MTINVMLMKMTQPDQVYYYRVGNINHKPDRSTIHSIHLNLSMFKLISSSKSMLKISSGKILFILKINE